MVVGGSLAVFEAAGGLRKEWSLVLPPSILLRSRVSMPASKYPIWTNLRKLIAPQVWIIILSMAGPASAACTPPDCAPAEGWDNFANNLGSDLAPLLALFGEQVTTQYLSESLSSIDSLLFALAPLGIITAMVAAIRVAGKPALRSLIGRAKESRGNVEADLMSSTSLDVCELWSGEGVVRVLGSPVLLQLVYVESDANDDTAGIYTFREAIKRGIYKEKKSALFQGQKEQTTNTTIERTPETGLYSDVENLQARNNPPNLSLNVSVKPLPRHILVFLVVFGVFVQSGVLVFAAISQYKLRLPKNNGPVADYAFPVFFSGTLALAIGVFLCAEAVEKSTEERIWEPTEGSKTVIWLQQGGQRVGDQQFESFARRSEGESPTIITSHKLEKELARSTLVTIAIVTTLLGFIAQFFGLRAMHSSVIVLQLVAILVMTAVRCCAHIQRESRNDITNPDDVEGYELDWLAKDMNHCELWEVITGPDTPPALPPPPAGVDSPVGDDTPPPDTTTTAAGIVMKTRARLASLSSDWKLENRATVKILQSTIEATMKDVFLNMTLNANFKERYTFKWSVQIRTKPKSPPQNWTANSGAAQSGGVIITLTRTKDENSNWGAWKTDTSELEAVLCLWISSLTEVDRTRAKDGKPRLKQIRLIGPVDQATKIDYMLWMNRGTRLNQKTLEPQETRCFGSTMEPRTLSTSTDYLFVETKGELGKLCAQELYALFILELVKEIEGVGGTTAQRINDSTSSAPTISDKRDDVWARFCLNNSNLASLARICNEYGLGTIEEAYFCIIPAFRTMEKLPDSPEMLEEARNISILLGKARQWEDAAGIYSWMYRVSKKIGGRPCNTMFINTQINNTFQGLAHKISMPIKNGGLEDSLPRVWNAAYELCKEFTETSEGRAACLVNLCLNFKITGNMEDPGTLFRITFDAIQGLDPVKDSTRIITAGLVRYRRDNFLISNELKNYLQNSELLRVTAETTVDSVYETKATPVPMDLQLVKGYLTPLQMAAKYGQEGILRQILEAGADINARPARLLGRTTLQAAAESGHKDIVELLLKAGANVNAPPSDNSGRTALQAAAESGHKEIVELLLNAGADVNDFLSKGSPIQAAEKAGYYEIAKLLRNAQRLQSSRNQSDLSEPSCGDSTDLEDPDEDPDEDPGEDPAGDPDEDLDEDPNEDS